MKWLYAIAAYGIGAALALFGLLSLSSAERSSTELTNGLLEGIVGLLLVISGQLAVQRRTLKIKTDRKD